jgi:hypothetical protein
MCDGLAIKSSGSSLDQWNRRIRRNSKIFYRLSRVHQLLSRLRKNYFGALELRWSARVAQQKNTFTGSPSETGGMGETRWESNLSTSCLSRMSRFSCATVCGAGGLFQHPVRLILTFTHNATHSLATSSWPALFMNASAAIDNPLLRRAYGQRARPSDPQRTARVRIGASRLRAPVSRRGSAISRRTVMNSAGRTLQE